MYNNTYNKQQLTLLLLLLFLISMTIICLYIIYSIHVYIYIKNIDNDMIFGCPKMEDTPTYGKLNS